MAGSQLYGSHSINIMVMNYCEVLISCCSSHSWGSWDIDLGRAWLSLPGLIVVAGKNIDSSACT